MKSSEFWIGMAVGALVGVALGVAYAPKPGEEVRGEVAVRARKFKDAAAERGRTALRRVKEIEDIEEVPEPGEEE